MKILVFLGSVRDSTPPKPGRLGERVTLACQSHLKHYFNDIDAELIDPLDYDLESIFKPHFAYNAKQAPTSLQQLADKIAAADGYVMVSPEYNHAMSPALANLLNHFGASLFAYKPSAIVTYSAGQWGGTRAAVNMRTFLSELGCLPVSAMIHVPKAQEVFTDTGRFSDAVKDSERWSGYLHRTLTQLWWWAKATNAARQDHDPHQLIQNFKQDPSQRNAPD